MKAQRRHELKTNELAQWLADLPDFWRKNARGLLYVTVVVIVVAVVAYFVSNSKRLARRQNDLRVSQLISSVSARKMRAAAAATQGQDASGELLEIAFMLDSAAQQTKDDTLAALALIKQGEVLRAESHYKAASIDHEAFEQQINRATRCYKRGLDKAPGNVNLAAMAKFGLGLCAEELRDFDEAQKIYREITECPDYKSTVFAVQAKERLETMADYKEQVFFAKAAVPQEQPDREVKTELLPEALEALVPNEAGGQSGIEKNASKQE